MTASDHNPLDADGSRHVPRAIDGACRAAAAGRRAVRVLSAWAKQFELAEPEFQLLWRLRQTAGDGFDQTALARDLAFSPAQVSAIVERLRQRGWIAQRAVAGDRRRHVWSLTDDGQSLLARMAQEAGRLADELAIINPATHADASRHKEAA